MRSRALACASSHALAPTRCSVPLCPAVLPLGRLVQSPLGRRSVAARSPLGRRSVVWFGSLRRCVCALPVSCLQRHGESFRILCLCRRETPRRAKGACDVACDARFCALVRCSPSNSPEPACASEFMMCRLGAAARIPIAVARPICVTVRDRVSLSDSSVCRLASSERRASSTGLLKPLEWPKPLNCPKPPKWSKPMKSRNHWTRRRKRP